MTAALTPPFAVAALVLCIAGVAKLRAPDGAAGALRAVALPGSVTLARLGALAEVALGAWALIRPSAMTAALVALVYAVFCGLSLALARRDGECGCFGDTGAPASALQSLLSGALALVAGAAAVAGAHPIGWVLGSAGAAIGVVAALGLVGAAYAAVLVYTALPQAWAAWSGR
jgi:Methylamine utilisation protein MauE